MIDPDKLERAPGAEKQELQGSSYQLVSESDLLEALEKAFDYRGDVTIIRRDGSRIEGYIFDRRTGASLDDSYVRLFPKNETEKISVPYSEVGGLEFTGRDTAAGKSWEAWVRKYVAKKLAGERNIELRPEELH